MVLKFTLLKSMTKADRSYLSEAPRLMGGRVTLTGVLVAFSLAFIVLESGVYKLTVDSSRAQNIHPDPTLSWELLMLLIGAAIGFLYSTFGEQTETFKGAIHHFNAFLGGAAVSDLLKGKDSWIRNLFQWIATQLGFIATPALPCALLAVQLIVGSAFFYYFKMFILNPLHQQQISLREALGRNDLSAMALRPIEINKEGKPLHPPAEIKSMAKRIIKESSEALTRDALLARAKSLYLEERFSRAEGCYRRIISEMPNDQTTLYELSGVLLAQEKWGEAVETLRQLTSLPHSPPAAWNLFATALQRNGNADSEVVAAYRNYLREVTDDADAAESLVRLLLKHGFSTQDRTELNQLFRIIRDAGNHVQIAQIRSLLKDQGIIVN